MVLWTETQKLLQLTFLYRLRKTNKKYEKQEKAEKTDERRVEHVQLSYEPDKNENKQSIIPNRHQLLFHVGKEKKGNVSRFY